MSGRRGPAGDPVVQLGFAVWALAVLPSLVPVLSPDATYTWADQYSDAPPLAVAILAMWSRSRRAASPSERRAWRLVALALVSWMCVRVLYLAIPYETWGIGADLGSDVFYLIGYLLIALALEHPPGRGDHGPGRDPAARAASMGLLVFTMGLLSYFVLAPSVFTPDLYQAWVSSLFLYAVLDAFLLSRCVAVLRDRELRPEWRATYRWFAVTFGLWLVGDVLEGMMYLEWLPWFDPGTPLDLFWHLPSFTVLLAVRARETPGSVDVDRKGHLDGEAALGKPAAG